MVEEALAGRGEELTQAAIATQVFGRKDDFDALLDPIVRIQAGRLRRSLERYYLLAGKADPVRIGLPKGSYLPAFVAVDEAEAAAAGARGGGGPPTVPEGQRRCDRVARDRGLALRSSPPLPTATRKGTA